MASGLLATTAIAFVLLRQNLASYAPSLHAGNEEYIEFCLFYTQFMLYCYTYIRIYVY